MKPNSFLKYSLGLAFAATGCQRSDNRPNIIFFLADDFGWTDTQVAFGPEVYPQNERHHTPQFVQMASEGAIFTQAYACPLSSPTRSSILTGVHSACTHITNPLGSLRGAETACRTPDDSPWATVDSLAAGCLDTPHWALNGVNPDLPDSLNIEDSFYATPYVRLLRDAGYFTIHIGKAHWATAGTPGCSPYNMGFIVNIAGGVVEFSKCGYRPEDNYGNKKDGRGVPFTPHNLMEYYGTQTHITQALTREALKTLDYPIRQKKPFYLFLSHYAVHTPIQDDPRFYQKYLDAGMDEGQARFASMVEGVDVSLGEIRAYLKEKGIERNTVLIVMGDNGGNSENKSKGGILHTQNKPLREGKASCYEGGIRVPMLVCWKGRVAPGTRLNTPVTCEDLFPTLLHLGGVRRYSTVQQVDGQDLFDLMTKGSQLAATQTFASQEEANQFVIPASVSGVDPDRCIISHYPHQWKSYVLDDIDYLSAIHRGDWKLVYRMRTGALELYNLKEDIGEQTDVAAAHPDIVRSLATELSDRLRGWNAQMPVIRSTQTCVPWPDEVLR
ncbi:MAG: sulfatase-like hydrolase/transferase [Bacteroidales bacterium]|nr:sulfatase-like hydrolase/transferase [Bacteroidales bacterium]